VTDGQGPASLGERGEDASEGGPQPRLLGFDEVRVGDAERSQVGLPGLCVDLAPAPLGLRAQTGLDDHPAGHARAEPGEEARQCLRRPLHAGGDEHRVVALQTGADLDGSAHTVGRQRVAVVVSMAPELDDLRHAR
jgi:hypothetical protein